MKLITILLSNVPVQLEVTLLFMSTDQSIKVYYSKVQ